jgi:beta-lactamase superfamily II metal-dependent hydrolase
MSIVKSVSVGDGDMFYIRHYTDSFTIIDCSMSEEDKARIVNQLRAQSKDKGITRFISTHPDEDHFLGLTYLDDQMGVVNFYCVKNEATKEEKTEDFKRYCALRDSDKAFYIYKGCTRKWLNETDETRGGAGIHILWPVTTNKKYQEALAAAKEGKSPNNISAILEYSLNEGATVLWMGDLETKFMEDLDMIPVRHADILFAPHHGRDSGKVPATWLEEIRPKLIIVGEAPSEDLHYYPDYDTITQNSAGDITLELVKGKVHVYVSNSDYSIDFLDNEKQPDDFGGYYIGTLKV